MSILLTGVEGFVGHNLAESFLAKGYSMLSPKKTELDLTDPASVDKYFRDNEIQTIVHCATTERVDTSFPPNTCENNLRMFFNLEKQLTPSMKLINLGSGSEYGRKYWSKKMAEEYFDEHVPEDGHSYAKYVISKYIIGKNDPNLICLRIFGIYGKYEDYRYKFISNAIVKNLLKMPIVINQNVVYDYIYINDFFRMIEHFIGHRTKHSIFNATPEEPVDLVTIAELINKVGDYKSEVIVLNKGIGVEYSGDNKKLLSEMKGFKFMPHEKAIADLCRYYASIKDTLDINAIKQDDYLQYAKKLKSDYFDKKK